MTTTNSRGSLIFESLMGLAFLSGLLPLLLSLAGILFLKIWCQHWLHQSLLCCLKGQPQASCQSLFRHKTTGIFPGISKVSVNITPTPQLYHGRYALEWGPLTLQGRKEVTRW